MLRSLSALSTAQLARGSRKTRGSNLWGESAASVEVPRTGARRPLEARPVDRKDSAAGYSLERPFARKALNPLPAAGSD